MLDASLHSPDAFEPLPHPGRREAAARAAAKSRDLFAAAERHSRRVKALRRIIPIVCVMAVLLAFLWRFFNPFVATVSKAEVGTVAMQGSKLTMEQPKVSGFKKDSKAYEMVAETATQDVKKPNIVEMKTPIARIEMDKGSWARLTALVGVYDSTTEKLVATDNVRVRTETGMEMRLKQANVDFKSGTVVSDQPVEVDLPNGWVKSDRVKIIDNGKTAIFEGRVRSEFRDVEPPAAKEAEKTETKP